MLLLRFFFFMDMASTEIYALSLHDALPICLRAGVRAGRGRVFEPRGASPRAALAFPGARGCEERRVGACGARRDRKSTRLNSSHPSISYAVFCLKKKKKQRQ